MEAGFDPTSKPALAKVHERNSLFSAPTSSITTAADVHNTASARQYMHRALLLLAC
jgi:hypothetical protein